MDDLIKRLQMTATYHNTMRQDWSREMLEAAAALSEAHATIARLEAENARLREALSLIAVMGFDDNDKVARRIGELAVVQARAALLPREGEG
jgi:hypothetical protein